MQLYIQNPRLESHISSLVPQTCLLLGVNVIGQRMDFYSMLHAFALILVMYRRRRKAIAEIWPKYCCFLACILTFQYFVCIGIPPAACKGGCGLLIQLAFHLKPIKITFGLHEPLLAFNRSCAKFIIFVNMVEYV